MVAVWLPTSANQHRYKQIYYLGVELPCYRPNMIILVRKRAFDRLSGMWMLMARKRSTMTGSISSDVYRKWPDGYSVRRMRQPEAETVEKWFSSHLAVSRDMEIARAIYPEHMHGFYAGEFKGEMVASITAIPVSEGIHYASGYYVDEKYRHRRFGTRARETAMKFIGDDIFAADSEAYLEHMNIRQGCVSAFKVIMYSGTPRLDNLQTTGPRSWSLNTISEANFKEIMAYDDKCFVKPGYPYREKTLAEFSKLSGGKCLGAIDATGHVCGFGFRRPALDSGKHVIGPLYADSDVIAKDILYELCEEMKDENVSMPVCETNQAATDLVKSFQLQEQLVMVRMHLNGVPEWNTSRVYAVTSTETCGF